MTPLLFAPALSALALSAQDPHAGHTMHPIQPPQAAADHAHHPAPAATPAPRAPALPHAADRFFDPAVMARARAGLLRENGDVRTTAVVVDRLEAGSVDGDGAWLVDAQGWSGGDIHRFWWKVEGEGDFDQGVDEAEVQALYSRAVRPFWDAQVGLRQDYRADAPDRTHAVLGVQGVAPGWWEIDAAAFLSTSGALTTRIEAEYDQRLTQRWILQPRFEADLSARDLPEEGVGRGLSGIEAGLRLRYEVRREFAPYVGVEWRSAQGGSRDHLRALDRAPDAFAVVIGLRAWR